MSYHVFAIYEIKQVTPYLLHKNSVWLGLHVTFQMSVGSLQFHQRGILPLNFSVFFFL